MKISLQDDLPLPTPRKNVTIYPCVTYRIRVPNQDKYHSCDSNFQGTYGITEQTFPVLADGLVDVKLMIPEDAVSVSITVRDAGDMLELITFLKKSNLVLNKRGDTQSIHSP